MQTCLAEIDVFSLFCQFFCQGKCYIGFIGSGAKHSLQRFPEEFQQQFTVVKLSNVADNKQRNECSLKVTGATGEGVYYAC